MSSPGGPAQALYALLCSLPEDAGLSDIHFVENYVVCRESGGRYLRFQGRPVGGYFAVQVRWVNRQSAANPPQRVVREASGVDEIHARAAKIAVGELQFRLRHALAESALGLKQLSRALHLRARKDAPLVSKYRVRVEYTLVVEHVFSLPRPETEDAKAAAVAAFTESMCSKLALSTWCRAEEVSSRQLGSVVQMKAAVPDTDVEADADRGEGV